MTHRLPGATPFRVQGTTTSEKVERRFQGVAIAPGIAHAESLVHWLEDEEIPYRKIATDSIPQEVSRFESALIATRGELLEIQERIATSIGAKDASIFDAHLLVVEDRTLIDEVLKGLEREQCNIEYVFHKVAEKYIRSLSQIDDPYLRERVVDIEDVARRVIRHMMGKDPRYVSAHDRPHIIVAHSLTPSDTAMMNRSLVLGFATEAGSKTSHTAIMARSLDIPAIAGLHNICEEINSGDDLLIDGYAGILILNPTPETLEQYGRLEQQKEAVAERLELIRDTASTTPDGKHIILSANIELPEEMEDVIASGAEGVGLYRTEFLYLNRSKPPDEEEQYETYRQVVEKCAPHSVIIRTLDIGGDKSVESLDLPEEQNPFLGCRAIRFCLDNPLIFKIQLRAILRASAHGNARLMYPMVSGADELIRANALLAECQQELKNEGLAYRDDIEIGAMIEVPSAALAADTLAPHVKFFSIGTNDLIQYTIAVDRINERIAHLYDPTHPAVVRLIQMIVKSAHDHGIWVGVCGEMAGDILLTPLLIGLEIDELSTGAAVLPRVKKAVQSLDFQACRELAQTALRTGSSPEILARCTELAQRHYGELLN